MDNLTDSSGGTIRNVGWILVLIVAILQSVTGLFLLFDDIPMRFEGDTGVAWAELIELSPTVGHQVEMSSQSATAGSLVIGLLSIAITLFALRKGEVWAWFTMWLVPIFMLQGAISLAQSETPWVAVMAGAFILLVVVGLLLSFPPSLRNQRAKPSKPGEVKGVAG